MNIGLNDTAEWIYKKKEPRPTLTRQSEVALVEDIGTGKDRDERCVLQKHPNLEPLSRILLKKINLKGLPPQVGIRRMKGDAPARPGRAYGPPGSVGSVFLAGNVMFICDVGCGGGPCAGLPSIFWPGATQPRNLLGGGGSANAQFK